MHFCPDEMVAITAFLSSLPLMGAWFRARFGRRAGPTDG